jgi:hypothetical protein
MSVVKQIQKETTFAVKYNEGWYLVTMMEDSISEGYIEYDVHGPDGEEVDEEEQEAVIEVLNENFPY